MSNATSSSSKPALRRSTVVGQRSDCVVGWRLRVEVVKKGRREKLSFERRHI